MLLLTGTIIRLGLENYLKYGLLVQFPSDWFSDKDWKYVFSSLAIIATTIGIGFTIEKHAASKTTTTIPKSNESTTKIRPYNSVDKAAITLHAFNLVTVLLVPSYLTYFMIFNPILGTLTMTVSCLAFLKLYSWCATNLDLRRAYRVGDTQFRNDPLQYSHMQHLQVVSDETNNTNTYHSPQKDRSPSHSPIAYDIQYPNNVEINNLLYFLAAPTLCYQPSYPRLSGPIRKRFVAKRLTELVLISIALYILIYQYAMPTLTNSITAMDENNRAWISERVLKLSVISATFWILGFYALFHSFLNLLAELLHFADRTFYLDWWNSVDLGAYWRGWNLPVHYFCKRHIMLPLTSPPFNLSPAIGIFTTFLISAIMHELLIGIPTHSVKGHSFVGMLMQFPLTKLTQALVRWRGEGSGLGNMVFWVSFCIVGQPFLVVRYYYEWVKNVSPTISQ